MGISVTGIAKNERELMAQHVEDETAERLWCFAPSALVSLVPEINQQYRWARIRKADDSRPSWSRSLLGTAFVLCESCGMYNGALGGYGEGKPKLEWGEMARKLQKKHPGWTTAKVERVAEENIARAGRKVCPSIEPTERFGFLKALCSSGPVVLVLTDGSTASPEGGGTYGLPDSAKRPRFGETYSISLKDCNINDFTAIQYWVPVTISSERE